MLLLIPLMLLLVINPPDTSTDHYAKSASKRERERDATGLMRSSLLSAKGGVMGGGSMT